MDAHEWATNPNHKTYGLAAGFLRAYAQFPDRPALDVGGCILTYRDLGERAAAFAATISTGVHARSSFVGVHASRSVDTYAAILGILLAGRAVVPLNPTFPIERTQLLIDEADLDAIILDGGTASRIGGLLKTVHRPLTIIMPSPEEGYAPLSRTTPHRLIDSTQLQQQRAWAPSVVDSNAFAYLFFTSGSTGRPKSVAVQHRNATAFVEMSVARYKECGLCEEDRFSQFYELSFDSSMFDLYICWAFGACLCCPSVAEWVNPNKYIEDKELSVIDIVPSMGHSMNRKGGWRSGRFPRLKLCRFGGEALSADLCAALGQAAPNAVIENVYGPTECTVDACYYRWDRSHSRGECDYGMVPIGYAGSLVEVRIVDEALCEVAAGQKGELMISGPQVTPGYWRNPLKTEAAFIKLPGRQHTFYRTGDLVRQAGREGPLVFLGRFDHQIKIGGVRIELGEIEMALREVAGTDHAVAIGWPLTSSGAAGIVAFLADTSSDLETIYARLKAKLPQVMVPREIRLLDSFPINPNGKVDRKALLDELKAPSA